MNQLIIAVFVGGHPIPLPWFLKPLYIITVLASFVVILIGAYCNRKCRREKEAVSQLDYQLLQTAVELLRLWCRGHFTVEGRSDDPDCVKLMQNVVDSFERCSADVMREFSCFSLLKLLCMPHRDGSYTIVVRPWDVINVLARKITTKEALEAKAIPTKTTRSGM
jgi:hypothetical protein